jgi:epoxyqueuosine reductase
MKEKITELHTETRPVRRGIDWFAPVKRTGLVIFGYTTTRWGFLNRILARLNLRHPGAAGGGNMKRTRGLMSYAIDYDRYSHDRMAAEGFLMKFFLIFLKVVMGHLKARHDYRRAIRVLPAKPPRTVDGAFWNAVKDKAEKLGISLIGFAPVDERYIFAKDHTMDIEMLFENAIVLGMEMRRDAIETAPGAAAGMEAMRVYADLGKATNTLADFVRSKGFRAIACHPLGGPILYPAMAERAGLGEMGMNGLLITKKYGPRQRLSLISTDAGPLPELRQEKMDVMTFCKRCMRCVKFCPNRAIFPKTVVSEDRMHQTHINTELCTPLFYEYSGCSICLKVCPLSEKGFPVKN